MMFHDGKNGLHHVELVFTGQESLISGLLYSICGRLFDVVYV